MTHCPDCGSERPSDQCPECGLTAAAAEVMLRRHMVRRTGWLLVGGLLFVFASQAFPALDLDAIWIFAGLIFFGALGLAFWIDHRAKRSLYVEPLKRIFYGLIPLPWIFGALLLLNGKFDTAPPHQESARVVSKFSMPGLLLRSRRLVVTSWRTGRNYERLPVDNIDFIRFRPGDDVIVRVQPGILGIPWVFGVYRDESHPAR
jgi:hypothetical protein